MESELSADKKKKNTPPVPIKTYQWEDLRRAREGGGYPWTHLLKPPLEGEVTAEDILRESTPRRSMSRECSKSRTHSPVEKDRDGQRILQLDSSPGSSRKHTEDGDDTGVHVPNFSKEVSLDSEDGVLKQTVDSLLISRPASQASSHLSVKMEVPKNASPKGILKRRVPEQQPHTSTTETKEKSKCCHPLVNKIKHLADKTLQKLERSENEKSPVSKRKKNDNDQEIRQLKSSPGSTRRQKFSAIKLGDSDEMSKTMSVDTPPPRKKKEHIYEDIDDSKSLDPEKTLQFSPIVDKYTIEKIEESRSNSNKENESLLERKSIASGDPSLVIEDNISLKPEEHVMEKLHNITDEKKDALMLDEEMDPEESNIDEIFQNQLEENVPKTDSPNITITEISDNEVEVSTEQSTAVPIETSPSPSPIGYKEKSSAVELVENEWSKPHSDHEYEIIEKPPPNLIFTVPKEDKHPVLSKTDDELSSTTSLERKYLQHTSDEEEQDDKENTNMDRSDGAMNAEALQRDIEDRFFVSTPSTVSRTECEVSTSQVDSSALENLPLKRSNRTKNPDSIDNKIQQRIKEGTGKLKTQAGKLKTKLQNIKTSKFTMPERPKINFPDRPKFKMPERPKISFPDRRKFSLPAKPKFQKINISEKLSFGDRKKFTLPDRPRFNVPDLSKFKMPDFSSLGRKKEYKEETVTTDSNPDLRNVATVDFEAKTYPRLFGRKKKNYLPKTSSSPTLNREDTPPPTFTFERVHKTKVKTTTFIPDSPEEPREYGNIESNYDGTESERKPFDTTYDFDNINQEYLPQDDNIGQRNFDFNRNRSSIPDVSPSNQEFTHINEINNDEFFVRPRGISRENIQVREYLSDEIRQAFKIPKNALALMGSGSAIDDDHMYANETEPDADPELMMDEKDHVLRYSIEDLNDKDDGYYTFPPVRPSRVKRKKKEEEAITYIDDSVHASMQFSEVDLDSQDDYQHQNMENGIEDQLERPVDFPPHTIDLHSIHEYANDDVIEYPDNLAIQSQTLPMPPRRKKRFDKKDFRHSSLSDMKDIQVPLEAWDSQHDQIDDIIVYRTEHEYIVPTTETAVTEQSFLPPRRNRSRSSRGTSLCDDDRTSHGADSLTLDTHMPHTEEIDLSREIRHESPGYATVDKGPSPPSKGIRRSKSKTPPVRRRKSNGSDRKYYTVGPTKPLPDRPPRKKSSTSLATLDGLAKRSVSGDITQYDEIDQPRFEESHKDLQSGEVVSKMKDRPLPPPPRPPRGPKRSKRNKRDAKSSFESETVIDDETSYMDQGQGQDILSQDVVEIEVSTQTDPLPDDVDFELSMEENLDISMSSSLRDIVDEEPISHRSFSRLGESPRLSRPSSRSEKSLKLSDPKISELSKSNLGRTSPTVILVERRVSSPTRINEHEEMLTEASLSVQRIDIDESKIPDVPPLPRSRVPLRSSTKGAIPTSDERALERVSEANRDIQVDNLITQRLQVRDLDVGRLNVSELQASKILVSDIEGMTLQVTELDSKSGHISVSGIEFSQSVIDEIVKKFAEITTSAIPVVSPASVQIQDASAIAMEQFRPESREEHTQTEEPSVEPIKEASHNCEVNTQPAPSTSRAAEADDGASPPQRPPPPDLTPLLYSYLQDITSPPSALYHARSLRERPFTEFHESQHQSPPLPTRRAKRKPAATYSESSSDENSTRPFPRQMPPPVRAHEPSITEAGAQFLRVCQNSISRTLRNIMNSFMTYISGAEDKKDVQMALVIFLVLIAGLIMFGLSDSRTIHHHHWEFFNPPDGKQ